MSEIRATAKVQFTVQIELTQPWGEDCAIGQLYQQAGKQAIDVLLAAIAPEKRGPITVHGEPKIIGVITERAPQSSS